MPKKIAITCEGAAKLPLSKMVVLQGNLKSLSPEARGRCRQSILTNGICYPFQIWKGPKGVHYILDATQRYHVLNDLLKEGYTIPDIPVNWIQAKDKRDAAMKLVAAASSYGEVTTAGLTAFATSFDLHHSKIAAIGNFPTIDMSAWLKHSSQLTSEVKFKVGDLSHKSGKTQADDLARFLDNDARHLILLYPLTEYDEAVERLDRLKAHYKCETVAEAVQMAAKEIIG